MLSLHRNRLSFFACLAACVLICTVFTSANAELAQCCKESPPPDGVFDARLASHVSVGGGGGGGGGGQESDWSFSHEESVGNLCMCWLFPTPDSVMIQFSNDGVAWAGLGISPSASMTDADIIIGWADPATNQFNVSDRWASQHQVPDLDTTIGGRDDLRDAFASFDATSQRTTVRFTRKLVTGDPYDHPIDLTKDTSFISAFKPDGAHGDIGWHGLNNHVSFSVNMLGSDGPCPSNEGWMYQHSEPVGDFVMCWQFPTADSISIQYSLPGVAWVGLGISPSGTMTNADIIVGWADPTTNKYNVTDRWSGEHGYPPLDTQLGGENNVFDTSASFDVVTNRTTVRFSRKLITSDQFDHPMLLDSIGTKTQFIYAWRPGNEYEPGDITWHGVDHHNSFSVDLSGRDLYPFHFHQKNGDFNLRWRFIEAPSRVEMQYTLPGSAWVGMGFSATGMTDADIILGFVRDDATYSISDRWASQHGVPDVDTSIGGTDDLLLRWAFRDTTANKTQVTFRRLLVTGDKYDKIITKAPTGVIYAWHDGSPGDLQWHGLKNHEETNVDFSGGPTPPPPPPNNTCVYQDPIGDFELTWKWHNTPGGSEGPSVDVSVSIGKPAGAYFGFGVGSSMTNADMAIGWIAGDGSIQLSDRFSFRHGVPQLDTQLGGEDNLVNKKITIEGSRTVMKYRRLLNTDDKFDNLIVNGLMKFIYAWKDGTPGDVSYHGPSSHNSISVDLSLCNDQPNLPSENVSQGTAVILTVASGAAIALAVMIGCGVQAQRKAKGGRDSLLNHSAPRFWLQSYGLPPGQAIITAAFLGVVVACLSISVISNKILAGDGESGDSVTAKPPLSPDIAMFYSFVLLVAVGCLLHFSRPGFIIGWLQQRINLKVLSFPTYGELILVAGWLFLNIWWFAYWWKDESLVQAAQTRLELAARVFGHVNELNMALLLFPVARNSVWLHLFGVSFERALKWHRMLGRCVFLTITIHLALWFRAWTLDGVWTACAVHFDEQLCPSARKAVWTGELLFGILIVMITATYEAIRRAYFEIFLYFHFLYIPVFVLAVVHSFAAVGYRGNLFKYLIVSAILYIWDRVVRMHRGRFRQVKVVSITRTAVEVVKVEFRAPSGRFQYLPGQYCFVCFPALSSFEWHPFSLSSCCPVPGAYGAGASGAGEEGVHESVDPSERLHSFHIKQMGRHSLTGKLAIAARGDIRGHSADNFPMLVDGPYGFLGDARDYTVAVFIAGGVGVTPFISVLRDLWQRRSVAGSEGLGNSLKEVHFVWVVKEPNCLKWFGHSLRMMREEMARLFPEQAANGENDEKDGQPGSSAALASSRAPAHRATVRDNQSNGVFFDISLYATNSKFVRDRPGMEQSDLDQMFEGGRDAGVRSGRSSPYGGSIIGTDSTGLPQDSDSFVDIGFNSLDMDNSHMSAAAAAVVESIRDAAVERAEEDPNCLPHFELGRPSVKNVIQKAVFAQQKHADAFSSVDKHVSHVPVGVYVCGPAGLRDAAHQEASELSAQLSVPIHVHHETFLL